jgi:hypothetical protein
VPAAIVPASAAVQGDGQVVLIRKFIAIALLVAGLAALLFQLNSDNIANRDFISYWAAGRQLLHGANPYDAAAISTIERSAGFHQSEILVMRNPPYALPLMVPFGFLPLKAALVSWLLLLIGCVVVSIHVVRDLYGRPANRLHLIGYCFAPIVECLFAGQTSILALLGLTLFLRFHTKKPFLAGMALFLCLLKPHLFLPFGAAILIWIVVRKSYRTLSGALWALGLSSAISLCLDPSAWTQYGHLAKTAGIEKAAIPTVSVFLRMAIAPNLFWLQFALAALATIWAIRYFWRNRQHWDWIMHGSPLLVISVWVAPYSWFTDEAVLLPAVLGGIYWIAEMKRSLIPFLAIAGLALFEVLCKVPMAHGYFWTTTAWLAWYLSSIRLEGVAVAGRPDARPLVRPVAPVEIA